MLRLLGKASSINVRKVLWACEEMGIAFAREDWGSGFRALDAPEFRALNPNGLVPVVVDGDVVLWESNTIVRYLAAKAGRADLLPADAAARARVEMWMDWQAGEFNNSWRYAFQALVRRNPAFSDAAELARSVAEWNRHVAIVNGRLKATGGYMAGSTFTVADIPIGLSINRWLETPMQRPDLPEVMAYVARLGERPAFLKHGRNGTP